MTPEGRLLESDAFSSLFVDANGSFNGKMAYERAGEPVEPRASSFKEKRKLEPAEWVELEQFSVSAVYPVVVPEGLSAGLYRSEFNYNSSVEVHSCLVLVKADHKGFLLVGSKLEFESLGKAISLDIFDAAESETEDDSEISFDMF